MFTLQNKFFPVVIRHNFPQNGERRGRKKEHIKKEPTIRENVIGNMNAFFKKGNFAIKKGHNYFDVHTFEFLNTFIMSLGTSMQMSA